MATTRQRKSALRNSSFVNTQSIASRSFDRKYDQKSQTARALDLYANQGREESGAFMRKADKNRLHAAARQIRKDASLRGNDYQYGTREQVSAQHNARYRNIRRSFGMSAG